MKKKETLRCKSNWLILPIFFLWCTGTLLAQTEKSRTIEKVFDGKTALWASHQYGDLILKKGSGTQIKAALIISASDKDEAELDEFLNHFSLETSDGPDNKLDIKTSAIIQCWNTMNGRTTIKFTDGKSFSGIKNFKMTLEISVPKLRYATLENKYATIKAEEGTASSLEFKLNDGKVEALGTFENLTLDMKYAKGIIGNFKTCTGHLYDCDLTLGNGGSLAMETKYSGLKIGSLQSLKIDCFDDDYKIGSVSGATEIKDKYSEYAFSGDLANVTLNLYDSNMEAKNAGNIQISDSKYTEYSFQAVNSLHFDASFDDEVHVVKIGTLSATDSKYTEYTADGLWKNLNFPSSYDDDLKIKTVGGTFESLVFDGKYTDVYLPIPVSVKYEIDAQLKYGKLSFPEASMEMNIYKEKDDETTVKAKVKGASAGGPKLSIKSYDGKINLM